MDANRIDAAIVRLDDALDAAGLARLTPATDLAALAELEREIAPYSLPPDLRRFWERVDFWSVPVQSSSLPDPCSPRTALDTHRMNQEPDLFPLLYGPPLLFPIARHSGDQWSIELVIAGSAGGTVFSVETGGDVWRIEYPSIADLVDVHAELIEEGRFERWENGRGSLSYEDEQERRQARLTAAGPHPLYGDAREIAVDPSTWPAHWLESAGIDRRDREPLGATHTIAELVEASRRGPVHGRIRGEVVRAGGSAAGILVLVADGGASLAVFCPAAATVWGPVMSRRYEFEVTVEEPVLPPADLPAAVATAVRPLD